MGRDPRTPHHPIDRQPVTCEASGCACCRNPPTRNHLRCTPLHGGQWCLRTTAQDTLRHFLRSICGACHFGTAEYYAHHFRSSCSRPIHRTPRQHEGSARGRGVGASSISCTCALQRLSRGRPRCSIGSRKVRHAKSHHCLRFPGQHHHGCQPRMFFYTGTRNGGDRGRRRDGGRDPRPRRNNVIVSLRCDSGAGRTRGGGAGRRSKHQCSTASERSIAARRDWACGLSNRSGGLQQRRCNLASGHSELHELQPSNLLYWPRRASLPSQLLLSALHRRHMLLPILGQRDPLVLAWQRERILRVWLLAGKFHLRRELHQYHTTMGHVDAD